MYLAQQDGFSIVKRPGFDDCSDVPPIPGRFTL